MTTVQDKLRGAGALLAILAVLFLAITMLATFALRGARLDLTREQPLHDRDGHAAHPRLARGADEPLLLLLGRGQQRVPALRSYAQRVRELLEELARRSDGKVKLTSSTRSRSPRTRIARRGFGLQACPSARPASQLYFGLAGHELDRRSRDHPFLPTRQGIVPRVRRRELIYRLAHPKKPVVGLLSTLPVDAGFDPRRGPDAGVLGDLPADAASSSRSAPLAPDATRDRRRRQTC